MNRVDITTEEILKGTYRESRVFSALTMGTIGVMEAVMIVFSIVNASFYLEEYLNMYRAFYVFLLGLVLLYFLANRYIKKDYDKRYRILNVMNPVYTALFYLWAMGITYNDLKIYGTVDPTLFMTFSLTMPVCLYVPFQLYDIIAVAADAAMLYLTVLAAGSPGVAINLAIFFVFQLVVGNALLISRRNLALRLLRMEGQKKEIEELSMSQSRFFSTMSHELRTPINVIMGMNEMILRQTGERSTREYAANIQKEEKVLLGMVGELLDYANIEKGELRITCREYDTRVMINSLSAFAAERANAKALVFKTDIDPGLPAAMYGDDDHIIQVVENLLSNAVKYTKEGSITLKIKDAGRDKEVVFLDVSVTDTGIGMREEDLEKLGIAFNRIEKQKNRSIEGVGIGIAIVNRLLKMMDSRIKVRSEYGKGSEFSFRLKQRVIDDTPIGSDAVTALSSGDGDGRDAHLIFSGAQVLVVDDYELNLTVTKNLLEIFGIVPDLAGSGNEALEMVRKKKYHLVLLDHMMPEPDGMEVLEIMKKEGLTGDGTRIVALTANAVKDARRIYMEAGFDEYLSKPIETDRLGDILRRFLPESMVTGRSDGKYRTTGEKDDIVLEYPARKKRSGMSPEAPEGWEAALGEHGISTESGLKYCSGKTDLYLELLKDFSDDHEKKSAELKQYYDSRDLKSYRICIHALKSIMKTLGADELSEEARKLEMATKENDEDYLRTHHEEFIREYEEITTVVRGALVS